MTEQAYRHERTVLPVLELARQSLSPSLIDDRSTAPLSFVARMLPIEWTAFWGFECRLGQVDAKADILFEIESQSSSNLLLANTSDSPLSEISDKSPAWQSLRHFARLWADPGHPFQHQIRNIWLELDTAATSTQPQILDAFRRPSIFFGPKAQACSNEHLPELIQEAIAILGQTDLDMGQIRTFVTSTPGDAQLFQVGLMPARRNQGLRLCVRHSDPEVIPSWLDELDWPGNVEALAALVRKISPMLSGMSADVDLGRDGIAGKIGLECYMDRRELNSSQWIPFLDFVEEADLCLAQKRQGLMDFPGIDSLPSDCRYSSDALVYTDLFRNINHFKLSFLKDRIIEAKAYLGLRRLGIHINDLLMNLIGLGSVKLSDASRDKHTRAVLDCLSKMDTKPQS